MITPYRDVCKAALINWNGLSEEDAEFVSSHKSIDELEKEVNAMSTVKYATIGLSKELKLSAKEGYDFFLSVISDDIDIPDYVDDNISSLSYRNIIGVLEAIHNGWVRTHSDKENLDEALEHEQLRQYTPLALIGFNEVKSDLLFLKPILTSLGFDFDEVKIEEEYHNYVRDYLINNNIRNKDDLLNLVSKGSSYYPAIDGNADIYLSNYYNDITDQIINNFKNNDTISFDIFNEMNTYSFAA